MRLPSSVRIGMFCRLGSFDDSRPVEAIACAIAGVHAAGLGIDLADQRIGIGGFQLLQLPPVEDARRQLVAPGRRASAAPTHRCPRRRSSSARPPASFISSNSTSPSCFARADIELAAGEAMDVALDHRHALLEVHRHAPQIVGVDLDAGALHRPAAPAAAGAPPARTARARR